MESPNLPLRTALVYDFDGTLAPGNIQEHSLLRDYLKMEPGDFWAQVRDEKMAHDADEILGGCWGEDANSAGRELAPGILRRLVRIHGA